MQTPKDKFFIGDIHGCFDEFMALMAKANFRFDLHQLYLVGDILNKGPKNCEVLYWVMKHPQIKMVLGNHELALIKILKNEEPVFQPHKNDFIAIKNQIGLDGKTTEVVEFLESRPLFIEEEEFILVHAGFVPSIGLRQCSMDILSRIRTWGGDESNLNNSSDPPWHELYCEEKLVIYGHWAEQGLKLKNNSIGLDSGCVYGQQLSGLWLSTRAIIQVQAQDQYTPIVKSL